MQICETAALPRACATCWVLTADALQSVAAARSFGRVGMPWTDLQLGQQHYTASCVGFPAEKKKRQLAPNLSIRAPSQTSRATDTRMFRLYDVRDVTSPPVRAEWDMVSVVPDRLDICDNNLLRQYHGMSQPFSKYKSLASSSIVSVVIQGVGTGSAELVIGWHADDF